MTLLDMRQKDKQQHFVAGMLVTGLAYPFIGHPAILLGIGVGLIKEYVIDEVSSIGEPDIWDAVATTLGALLVGGLVWLAERMQILNLS